MKSNLPALDRNPARPNAGLGFEGRILRLVKSVPERRAIESGQVDAVMDAATGNAILLPEAQRSLIEGKSRFRSLVALCSDWYWQTDEHYRFAMGESSGGERSGFDLARIIGKTLWELPFDNMSEADWQTHRTQLQWRASFHDLELRYLDRAGAVRWVSLNGEPIFDEQEQFKGYLGTARDITEREHAQAARQESNRFARAAFDALSAQICVLDPAGTVVLANKACHAFAAAAEGLAANVPEGANYLAVCDKARGNERRDGVAIAAAIRQVIAGNSSLFRHEYVCDSPAGRCWFNLTVTAFFGDGAGRVVVSRENVTEHKRVERIPGDGAARGVVSRKNVAGRNRHERLRGLEHKDAKGDPIANRLLAALPGKEYRRLLTDLEPVTLTSGEVLFEPGDPIRHVYFPNDCLVSLVVADTGHEALEIGLVGREGMVGIPLALGMDVASARALVQRTGMAMRMEAARFQKEFQHGGLLQLELYRYTHTMLAQARQTAACNRFHLVEARLARWLLTMRDRTRSEQFHITQELLGSMLGVLRGAVTNAAGALQQRKLISYRRGNISILDWKGLEAAACRCYQIIRNIHS